MPSAKLDIQLDTPYNTFVLSDSIKGTVNVTISKDISISTIQISLKGYARTDVTHTAREWDHFKNRYVDRDVSEWENFTLVDQSFTLFPPSNIREVTSTNSFTMTPGEYSYKFVLEVPETGQSGPLPPSFAASAYRGSCKISYYLEAKAVKSSTFSMNSTADFPIIIKVQNGLQDYRAAPSTYQCNSAVIKKKPAEIPLSEEEMAKQSKMNFMRKVFHNELKTHPKIDLPIVVLVDLHTPACGPGSPIKLGVSLATTLKPSLFKHDETEKSNGLGVIHLSSVCVNLNSEYFFYANGHRSRGTASVNLFQTHQIVRFDFADAVLSIRKSNDGLSLYQLDVPPFVLEGITIDGKRNNTQSFIFRNEQISNSHSLDLTLTYSSKLPKEKVFKTKSKTGPLQFQVLGGRIVTDNFGEGNEYSIRVSDHEDYSQLPQEQVFSSKEIEAQQQEDSYQADNRGQPEEQLPSYEQASRT